MSRPTLTNAKADIRKKVFIDSKTSANPAKLQKKGRPMLGRPQN